MWWLPLPCFEAIGVNSSSKFEGKIFIYLPSTTLYQSLCKLEIDGKRLVLNQYCVGSLPVNSGLGQGVGLETVQIEANASNFK
jgi:hypothetical protein